MLMTVNFTSPRLTPEPQAYPLNSRLSSNYLGSISM